MEERGGSCERCASALERGDLRCAVCGQATPAPTRATRAEALRILRCEGCSAAVSYDIEEGAPRCAFCDSVMRVETVEDPQEQTEAWLPFRVDGATARQALQGWLATRGFFYAPESLKREARFESLQPIWWVGWLFEASAEIYWTADSNAGARRSAWAPHSGCTSMLFENLVVSASRGLSDRETDALLRSYAPGSAEPAPGGLDAGVEPIVECFEVQRSVARRRVAEAIRATAAARIADGHVPGSRVRKVGVSVLPRSLKTRRLGFPAHILAYRYRKRLYRVVVSGQDPAVVYGRAPLSLLRVFAVVGGVVALIGLIVLVVRLAG